METEYRNNTHRHHERAWLQSGDMRKGDFTAIYEIPYYTRKAMFWARVQ